MSGNNWNVASLVLISLDLIFALLSKVGMLIAPLCAKICSTSPASEQTVVVATICGDRVRPNTICSRNRTKYISEGIETRSAAAHTRENEKSTCCAKKWITLAAN